MGSTITVVAEERTSILHIARTTIAALASQLIAQALHMPEPYWATVTTIVIMQSSLGAAWMVSWKRQPCWVRWSEGLWLPTFVET